MSQDVAKFIAIVGLHFPPPKVNDEETHAAWCASMVRILGGYSAPVLAEAARQIVAERDPKKDGRFFPVPKECTDACDAAARRLKAAETPLLAAPKEVPHHARTELARDLMLAPLGQQAKREGWDTTMYHFCVENMRAPQGKEVDDLKRKAKEFAADYQRLLKNEHPFGGPLARLADSMMREVRKRMGQAA